MRARTLGHSILFLALAAMVSCATPIKTDFDMDPEVNITAMSTYAWISDEPLIDAAQGAAEGGVSYVSPIDDKRIRRAVDAELRGKGYRQVTLDEAQLVVTFAIGREQKTQVYNTPGRSTVVYPGYGYGYGNWYQGSSVEVRQYEEGTLTLQFFDRASQQAVWVGWASKRLSGNDDRQEVINKAVFQILQKFPVRS